MSIQEIEGLGYQSINWRQQIIIGLITRQRCLGKRVHRMGMNNETQYVNSEMKRIRKVAALYWAVPRLYLPTCSAKRARNHITNRAASESQYRHLTIITTTCTSNGGDRVMLGDIWIGAGGGNVI